MWTRAALMLFWGAHACAQSGAPAASAAADASPHAIVRPSPLAAVLASPIGLGTRPAEPWAVTLLPGQKKPATRFDTIDLDGQRVLRVRADRSYGNLVHAVPAAEAGARTLRWSWRIDDAPDVDLRTKKGDDVALKVCALYDWPRDRLSFGDRAKLAAASALSGQPLPTATVCYVVDARLPVGTWLVNAYTARLRMLVVQQHRAGAPRAWTDNLRDLHDDFRRAFVDEWREGDVVPPLRAVLIGADTDNTETDSLGYVRSIDLR